MATFVQVGQRGNQSLGETSGGLIMAEPPGETVLAELLGVESVLFLDLQHGLHFLGRVVVMPALLAHHREEGLPLCISAAL